MEPSADGATDLLVSTAKCPRCDGRLKRVAKGSRCASCRYTFRDLGNVPLLLREPEIARKEWAKRVADFRATMDWTLIAIKKDLERFDLLPRTRARLEKTLYANVKNAEQVMSLLADTGLDAGADAESKGEHESRTSVRLIRLFELLLRDWAWDSDGSTENRRSFERFLRALGGFEVQGHNTEPTTFMVSPLSTHARVEGVFTFSATKRSDAPLSESSPPAWIVLPHLSVPRVSAAVSRDAHPAFQHLRELVDGKRSLKDIAKALAERMRLPDGVDPVDVTGALLLKLAEDATKPAP